MGSESSDFYSGYGVPAAPYYENPRAYPQSSVGGFAPPPPHHAPPYGGQVALWNQNPFTPQHGQPGGYGYGHEMMRYGQHGYYGAPGPVAPSSYGMPPHLSQMIYSRPPPPPATEVGAPASAPPPEEKKPDPELERVKAQLELMQIERKKAEEARERAEAERKIREDAEREFKNRMEAMKLAQAEAQKEIELARIAAEHAARERIEEERKAEEERKRIEAEMRAQAAREERERIEKEKIAEEERAKAHAAALEKAERDAREKYEQARLAEEERKLQIEKERAALEAETRNKIAAEQKAAEEAAAAAAAKAAEDAARKEMLEKEAKTKAIQEYEEKMAAEKKEAEDKAKAEAAAKLAYENEFKLRQEEERQKAEEAAKAAEAAKVAEEEKAKLLLAQAKADLEKSGDDGKEPVKFKDAVGRKFTFPFRLAANWGVSIFAMLPLQLSSLATTSPSSSFILIYTLETILTLPGQTMKELINQAFSHIATVGPHVRAGHYDLEGPEGELILKEIWDTTIQPGWQITMKMWPDLDLLPTRDGQPGAAGARAGFPGSAANPMRIPSHLPANQRNAWMEAQMRTRAQQAAAAGGGMRMPQGMGGAPQRPPAPPGMFGAVYPGRGPAIPPGVQVVDGDRKSHKKSSSSKAKKTTLGWLSGASGTTSKKK